MIKETEAYSAWDQDKFRDAIEHAWPGVMALNMDRGLSPYSLRTVVILCPLYGKGGLRDAGLIGYPDQIEDSRVSTKVLGYEAVLSEISNQVKGYGGTMELVTVLANKGVLLGQDSTDNELNKLAYHKKLYESYFGGFCCDREMKYTSWDYDQLEVDYPRFIDPEAEIPGELGYNTERSPFEMLNLLGKLLKLPEGLVNNKKNRRKVEDIIQVTSFISAFWLIAGYLAFDYKISDLVGSNGIYLTAERMVSLWGTASFTPSLKKLPRIQIPA